MTHIVHYVLDQAMLLIAYYELGRQITCLPLLTCMYLVIDRLCPAHKGQTDIIVRYTRLQEGWYHLSCTLNRLGSALFSATYFVNGVYLCTYVKAL